MTMRKMMALVFAVVLPAALWAQSDDVEAMRRRLAEIEARLAQMEKAQTPAAVSDVQAIQQEIKEMGKRLDQVEKAKTLDRIRWGGDFRFEAHNLDTTLLAHIDGVAMQNMIVNTLFYYGATGSLPSDPSAVESFIAANYGDYLYYTDHLSFEDLKQMMGSFPPAMQQMLLSSLAPYAARPAYDWNNDILYTSRLRLNFDAEVAKDITFTGRLSMYKTWGDSTGVQMFNGQPNSFSIDGSTSSVPNSDALRVERAYFTWNNIGGKPLYLSIGRRPSTEGPPMNLRQGELRGGTPMGSLIDFQFDGITAGWKITENSNLRLCYGLGYESGWGNGQQLQQPADRLKDAQFLGINWDIWNTEKMLVQSTVARAFSLTDSFNGLIVLPNNPVTGASIAAPVVMRYSPAANLGDMDLAGLLVQRTDGPVDWFANINYVKSHPDNVTTPFGGLFCDPFETPVSHSGTMFYLGGRYNFSNKATSLGLEFNHGSKYWFNFTPAQDDILAAKTNTRGEVYEAYLLHRIGKRFQIKLDYSYYNYDYSGSGWHIGAPKALDSMPMLGYPTYSDAQIFTLSMSARF